MGKKKKKIRKQINPGKSNKMIIAVAVGLVVVFSLLFWLVATPGGAPGDKGQLMSETLEYLRNREGIAGVECFPDQDKVVIIYESYKKKDYQKIARYAGLKLSNTMGDREVTVVLAADKGDNEVYSIIFKDGRLVRQANI